MLIYLFHLPALSHQSACYFRKRGVELLALDALQATHECCPAATICEPGLKFELMFSSGLARSQNIAGACGKTALIP
jgi:hypothetical protein